jgi:hypothetical protein
MGQKNNVAISALISDALNSLGAVANYSMQFRAAQDKLAEPSQPYGPNQGTRIVNYKPGAVPT